MVGVVLSVVVLDDERLPLDSVVVALVQVGVAVPREGDVVQTGRVDGGTAFLFDVGGEVLEVLGHQVLEQLLLVGRHLRVGQADGSRFDGGLRSAGTGDFIGSDLAHPAELLLIGRAELEDLPRDVFLGAEDSNLSVLARFNRAGVGTEELGSAGDDLAVLDAEVQRQVMSFHTPAPEAGIGWLTEDTQVVLVRIATVAAEGTITPFQQLENLFETHDVQGLVVPGIRETAADQAESRLQRGTFECLERQPLARPRDEVPVQAFGIVELEGRFGSLLGSDRTKERLRGDGHRLTGLRGLSILSDEQCGHRDDDTGGQEEFPSCHEEFR